MANRLSKSSPSASNSRRTPCSGLPAQGPKMVRPPDSTSRVAHSSARYSGLRGEVTMQAVPSLTRLVRWESADSSAIGLVARLGEQAVADPDGVEPELLDGLRQVEQLRDAVAGRDERLPVVEVDPELDRSLLRQACLQQTRRSPESSATPAGTCVNCQHGSMLAQRTSRSDAADAVSGLRTVAQRLGQINLEAPASGRAPTSRNKRWLLHGRRVDRGSRQLPTSVTPSRAAASAPRSARSRSCASPLSAKNV